MQQKAIVFDATTSYSVGGLLATANIRPVPFLNLYTGLGAYHARKYFQTPDLDQLETSMNRVFKLGVEGFDTNFN